MNAKGVCAVDRALWLLYLDQRDAIDAALGHRDIPVVVGRHAGEDGLPLALERL